MSEALTHQSLKPWSKLQGVVVTLQQFHLVMVIKYSSGYTTYSFSWESVLLIENITRKLCNVTSSGPDQVCSISCFGDVARLKVAEQTLTLGSHGSPTHWFPFVGATFNKRTYVYVISYLPTCYTLILTQSHINWITTCSGKKLSRATDVAENSREQMHHFSFQRRAVWGNKMPFKRPVLQLKPSCVIHPNSVFEIFSRVLE